MKRWGLLIGGAVFASLALSHAAHANSGSLSVANAGSGAMTVTAALDVNECGSPICGGWYAVVSERHASLACADDKVLTWALTGFETAPGSVTLTEGYRPFFPREARLCLYIFAVAHAPQLAAELLYQVPSGYGRLRSTGYNCANFANQAQANYYRQLYPDDPSRLDADRDGIACEANPCPCGADLIPAEPPPPSPDPVLPPSPPIPSPLPTNPAICAEGHRTLERDWRRVEKDRKRFKRGRGLRGSKIRLQALRRSIRIAHQAERQQIELCGAPRSR